MYNAVHISKPDQKVYRFSWRGMEVAREPDFYVLTRVTFGDKPSRAIAILALHETTKLNDRYVDTGNKIVRNLYVDDLLINCPSVQEAQNFVKGTEKTMREGGCEIKHWIGSDETKGCQVQNNTDSVNEKVLGLNWNPVIDKATSSIEKKRGLRMREDISRADIETLYPDFLTRRMKSGCRAF